MRPEGSQSNESTKVWQSPCPEAHRQVLLERPGPLESPSQNYRSGCSAGVGLYRLQVRTMLRLDVLLDACWLLGGELGAASIGDELRGELLVDEEVESPKRAVEDVDSRLH